MRILDRYLLRQFVQVFVICFISLTGLYIVFDAFTNLDNFMTFAEKNGGLARVMTEYYAYRSIYFFDRTSAMLALTAAMFTVTWLQRHNEFTALSAAGLPNWRILAPVLLGAVAVSISAAAVRELVVPRIQRELSLEPKDLSGEIARIVRPTYDHRTDILLRGRQAYAATQRIRSPDFLLPPSLDRYGRQIIAREAFYHPPRGDRPGGYLLKAVEQPRHLDEKPSLLFDGEPLVITPYDAPDWLEADQCFVVTDVGFEQMTVGHNWLQCSSTRQLIAGLRNPSLDFGAEVRVAIHMRMVQPLLDAALLLLGLPLVLSRENGNLYVAVGLCLLVVVGFSLVVIGAQYLGSIYLLSPAFAAWLPVLISVPPVAVLAERFWN